MASRAYSLTVPPGSDPANTLHTIIQNKGKDMSERLVQGGHKITAHGAVSAAAENNDGKHAVGIDDNTGDAGSFKIYDTAGTTVLLEIYGTAHGSKPGQIEAKAASSMKFVGTNVTTGTDPGHLHTHTYEFHFTNVSANYGVIDGAGGNTVPSSVRLPKACTITRIDVEAGGIGTARTFELRKTSGVPANSGNIATDGVSSVSVGSVAILSTEYRNAATGLAVAATAGEYLTIKRTLGAGGNAAIIRVTVTE